MENTGGLIVVKDNLALVLDPVEETHRDTEELNWCSISLSEIIARGFQIGSNGI